jgi:hypothetical protein
VAVILSFQLRQLGGRGSFEASGEASRRRRGPVALRPRLSPGVPLSRDGAADLGSGTRPVKHLLQARQLCRNQEVKCSVGSPCVSAVSTRVHGAMSDCRVRRSWRRGPRPCPPRNSKWLGLQIRSCGGTPCASARASSFSAISHAGHHSVGGIPWYRCAYCGLRRTWRSPLWYPGFRIGRSAVDV